jgi:SNF2 family DNA or RNA helicase
VPSQNNLTEYYTMICWCRPNYLGTDKAFKEEFVDPIEQGAAAAAAAAQDHCMTCF